jgi:hypothetical protein
MAVLIDEFYVAADHAGLLKEGVWSPSQGSAAMTAKVDFRAPDDTVLDGLGPATDYAIRYPPSSFIGLIAGKTLTIDGQSYRVREIRAIGDGSEKRATLTRV